MGAFDAVSGFLPHGPKALADAADTYRQNGGAGVRVYTNGIDDGRDPTIDLFYEIRTCDAERSITDVGGSFSFFLLPTAPWDELIRADDFLRIFMGDQIVTSAPDANAYNFASGQLDQNNSLSVLGAKSTITIPMPGSIQPNGLTRGAGSELEVSQLVMHERMICKVDRVSKVKNGPGPNQGTTAGYTVSGRSFGAIIQDISLYYNEFLAPLNAVNIFLGSTVAQTAATPDELIKEVLAIILTSVPFPQWTLPDALVADLNYAAPGQQSIRDKNIATVNSKLDGFRARLDSYQASGVKAQIKGDAIAKLGALVASSGTVADNSPFAAVSIDGILECFGSCFNRTFLSSVTTGLFDLIKHLSNDVFNEFWFDLCPGGDPEGGRANDDALVPTFVLRQRPYDVTQQLITGVSDFLEAELISGLSNFPQAEGSESGGSLLDIMDNSFSVMGPMANPTVELIGSFAAYADQDNQNGFMPTVMPGGYDVGYSGHDRQNAWICLGDYDTGQSTGGSSREIAITSGGFNVDVESIKKYGMRVFQISTQYAQPNGTSVQERNLGETLATFSQLSANWNFANPCFLNGRISCRFLRQARIGVPVKYFETRITPDNPYPKMELFYVQGISDHYELGAPITSSLTVVRGLRYQLSTSGDNIAGPSLKTTPDLLAGLFNG